MKNSLELNKVIHQPIRTRIMVYLASVKSSDYTTVKKKLELSDGHMSTHMKELISHEYVSVEKTFENNKPKTTYKITKEGKKRLLEYLSVFKTIIGNFKF